MRRLMAVVLLVGLSAAVYAEGIKISAWGGMATVAMDDINKLLGEWKTLGDLLGAATSKSDVKSGTIIGLDAGYEISPGISVGTRLSQLTPVQGKVTWTVPGAQRAITADSSLTSVMLGASYDVASGEISVPVGLYAGLGMASGKTSMKDTTTAGGLLAAYDVNYSGSGIVIDLSAAPEYKVSKSVSLGVNLGYRLAKIAELKLDQDADMDGDGAIDSPKGTVVKDGAGNKIAADFGGLTAAVSVSYRF